MAPISANSSEKHRNLCLKILVFFGIVNIFFINFYSVNIPYWDEWEFFNPGAAETFLNWNYLFVPHGEHFIFPTRLIVVTLFKLGLLNFRFLIFINQIFWFGFLITLYRALQKLDLLDQWVQLSFIFFLTTLNFENQTWGFQSCFPIFLLITAVSIKLALSKKINLQTILILSALLMINTFTLSAGVVAGLAILVSLAANLTLSTNALFNKLRLFALPAVCWLLSAIYFFKMILASSEFPIQRTAPWNLQFWKYFLSILALGLGSEEIEFYLLGFLPLACFALTFFYFIKDPQSQKLRLLLSSYVVTFFCLGAISFGRASMGLSQSKSSRYAAIGLVLLPLMFATLMMVKNTAWCTNLPRALFALLVILNLNSLDYGAYIRIYDDRAKGLECVKNYYLESNAGDCPILYPKNLAPKLDEARRLNVGFAQ